MPQELYRAYEVVVAGGGTAGVIAAVAAARRGARTLLVEQNGFVGGTAAMGLPILGFHDNRERRIVGGIPWELMERLMRADAAADLRLLEVGGQIGRGTPEYCARSIGVYPEALKYEALRMLREAGVELMLHAWVADVALTGGRITGLVVENKSGRLLVPAGCVVDCTGDGDVAARAEAPFERGRPGDQITQPLTMLFVLSQVDLDRAEAAGAAERRRQEVLGSEFWRTRYHCSHVQLKPWQAELDREFPELAGTMLRFNIRDWGEGVYYAGNMLHIPRLDASDGDQLSRAEVQGRDFVWRLTQFLRAHVPGFERCHLVGTFAQIGIRETRRILGDYYLTYEDVLEARRFPDGIALCGYWVDIHDHRGVWLHTPAKGTQIKDGGAYAIPYRCLVPRGVDGLLVAGRCLSASHEAQASARVMAPCMAMGEAAGTAAALALGRKSTPRALDPQVLRHALLEQGAFVDGLP